MTASMSGSRNMSELLMTANGVMRSGRTCSPTSLTGWATVMRYSYSCLAGSETTRQYIVSIITIMIDAHGNDLEIGDRVVVQLWGAVEAVVTFLNFHTMTVTVRTDDELDKGNMHRFPPDQLICIGKKQG